MSRGILLASAAVVLSVTTAAFSQPFYAYTETGTPVTLTVQDSIISAKLIDDLTLWTAVFSSFAALDGDVAPELICDGFELLRVRPGFDPVTLVSDLRSHSDIMFANLSFLDPDGKPIYLTETLGPISTQLPVKQKSTRSLPLTPSRCWIRCSTIPIGCCFGLLRTPILTCCRSAITITNQRWSAMPRQI